jgi:predicted metal-dependent phosphoesterase TrpH
MALDQSGCALQPAQDASTLRAIFQTLQADSCPTHFNFHMHTVHSDGRLEPEALMQQALDHGLTGLTITDHHSVGGYERAQAWLNRHAQNGLPQLWTGFEVTSQLLEVEVHILGYAFDPSHPALDPYLQGQSPQGDAAHAQPVVAAIHAAGGVAVLAHPVRYRKPPEDLIPAAVGCGIDGVEVFYAYDNPSPWRPSPVQTARVEALRDRFGLLRTCGTDTHGCSLLQRI